MSKENNLHDFLVDLAGAIREKKGTSEPINAQRLSEEIKNLPSGGEVNTFGEVMVDKTGFGTNAIISISLNDSVTEISSNAFEYCRKLKEVAIHEGITIIGNKAFNYCQSLERVNLPKTLNYLGEDCFAHTSALQSITFQVDAPLTSLPMNFLWDSSSIQQVVLPRNIKTIGGYAFQNCSKLELLDCSLLSVIPNLVSINAFMGCSCKIVVPDNLYDEWIVATNWSTYADRIVKASEYQPNNE